MDFIGYCFLLFYAEKLFGDQASVNESLELSLRTIGRLLRGENYTLARSRLVSVVRRVLNDRQLPADLSAQQLIRHLLQRASSLSFIVGIVSSLLVFLAHLLLIYFDCSHCICFDCCILLLVEYVPRTIHSVRYTTILYQLLWQDEIWFALVAMLPNAFCTRVRSVFRALRVS